MDRQDKRFAGIVILVHIVFFLLASYYKRIYMGDSMEYIYEAVNIKDHFFFYSGNPALPIDPEYMTQRQPLYPLCLLGVYLFSMNNWIVLVLQNVLSVFNVYNARKAAVRIGYNKKYDWLLLLLIIAYPAQFINANTIAPDILLQTFTLLYFGSFINFFQRKELKHAGSMSLWLIAGLFVKPVLYPFVVVHIVAVVGLAAWLRLKLQRIVVVAIVPLCAVLCYNYWNYTRTGKFHFSSNQAFNAVFYYAMYFDAAKGSDSGRVFLQKERANIATIPDYKDRYDYANERGVALLKENFAPYMAFHLRHSARILVEPGKAEMDLFTGRLTYGRLFSGPKTGFFATLKSKGLSGLSDYFRNNPSMPLVLLVLIFNIIRLIGLLLFFARKNVHWVIRAFTFILVAYFSVAAGPIANTRYFLPVSLIVIWGAAVGFVRNDRAIVIK